MTASRRPSPQVVGPGIGQLWRSSIFRFGSAATVRRWCLACVVLDRLQHRQQLAHDRRSEETPAPHLKFMTPGAAKELTRSGTRPAEGPRAQCAASARAGPGQRQPACVCAASYFVCLTGSSVRRTGRRAAVCQGVLAAGSHNSATASAANVTGSCSGEPWAGRHKRGVDPLISTAPTAWPSCRMPSPAQLGRPAGGSAPVGAVDRRVSAARARRWRG